MKRSYVWRLTAPVVGVSFLLLCLGFGSAWYVHRLDTEVSQQMSQYISGVAVIQTLVFDIRDSRANLRAFAGTGDRKYLDAIPDLLTKIGTDLEEAENLVATVRGRELMEDLWRGYRQFRPRYEALAAQVGKIPDDEFRVLANDFVDPVLLDPAREYLDIKQSSLERASQHDQRVTSWMGMGLILIGVCGAVAGLLSGFGLARGISRSIFELSVPIRDAAGQLDEIVGPVTMTTRWNLEEMQELLERMGDQISTVIERMQRSHRQALKAEQLAAVGQLAAGMAHELRNPLMAMKILVQSAADGPGQLSGRDLAVLEDEISRLEDLFQTFLDFARPPHIESQTVDLRAVVEQVLGLFNLRAERKGVHIRSSLPAQAMLVRADAPQLRQVLLNLVLNALDAVEPGGTIWISARHDDGSARPDGSPALALPQGDGQEGPRAGFTIEVADDGCGLPVGVGDKIFEPFVSTKETGTGLGLSICKQIVEAHGGTISAASRTGGGAVFSFTLPATADAPLASEAAS